MLEESGWESVTMRPLADRLHIRAPSLYKHFSDRDQIKSALIIEGLIEIGKVLHETVDDQGTVPGLLEAYRNVGLRHPNLYRLATSGQLNRNSLPEGLEDWAGLPFYLVTDSQTSAQALWSFAHGTMILELDGRYPAETNIDQIWKAGAESFTLQN